MITKEIKIVVDTGDAEKNIAKVKDKLEDTGKSSEGLSSKLDGMTAGAITKFRGMVAGLQSVAMGFKSVGMAIALSGLGLLVITIAALTQAFKASEAGEDKFARIMGVIGQVTSKLTDLLADLGEKIIWVFENPQKAIKEFLGLLQDQIINRVTGLIQLFPQLGKAISLAFKGEFAEAGKVAFDATAKVTTGIANATDKLKGLVKGTKEYAAELARQAKLGGQIADMRDKAEDLERELIVKRAKADAQISDLRAKVADKDNFSLKQRIAFGKQAQTIANSIADQEIRAAKLKADAIILENSLTKSNTAALLAEENAKAEVFQKQTARNQANKTFIKEIGRMSREEAADTAAALKVITDQQAKDKAEKDKAAADALKLKLDNEKAYREQAEALEKQLKESVETPAEKEMREYAERYQILSDNHLSTELLEQIHKDKLAQIDQDYWTKQADAAIKQSEIDKKKADDATKLEQDVHDAKVNLALQGLSLIESIAKEGSAIAKAAGVAQATISGIQGVQNAFTSASASPITAVFPAYPFLQAGIAGVFSALQIAKILKGGKGGSSGGSSGGGGGAETKAPSFNMISGTGTNQIVQSVNDKNQTPIKAFVVSQDMTSQQQLDNNIKTVGNI